MPTFHNPKNTATTTVAQAYTAGSGSLVVADATQLPAPPFILSTARAGVNLSILEVTAVTGNTLTISGAIEGTTDISLLVGDTAENRATALAITELQDALEAIFYQPPAFSSFAISGQPTAVEVGSTVSGTKTFVWSTVNPANVVANSLAIRDVTAGSNLATGLADDGSQSLAVGTITNMSSAVQQWRISGTDTQAGTFSRDFDVQWLWRLFAGTSASPTLDAAGIQGLASGALAGAPQGTYTFAAGGYKYLAWPDSFGGPSDIKDAATGLRVAMADSSFDAAYSNTQGLFSYALVSVTNGFGVTTNYRVYRSAFVLGGSLTAIVS